MPDWPFGLKTDPEALTALPGVCEALDDPQVVPGAPGCPGPFGLVSANAVVAGGKANAANSMAMVMPLTIRRFIARLLSLNLLKQITL